jgi:hypothetical protein
MDQTPFGFFAAAALAMMIPSTTIDGPRALPVAHRALTDSVTPPHQPVATYGKLPIPFEPNVGQVSSEIEYSARGSGYVVTIGKQGAVLSLHRTAPVAASSGARPAARLRLYPLRAGAKPRLLAERKLDGVSNYFIGNDPTKWHRNVANYAAIRYERVYPGIDWVIYGDSQQLEYDFVVAPRADPRRIRVRIEGADSLSVAENGDLLIKMQDGILRQLKPVIYQASADGVRHTIDGHFVLANHNVGFALGDYDHSRTLIIDPAFVYSTYLGGSGFNLASAIAADGEGNAYVAGTTDSTDFPTEQPLQGRTLGQQTAFISKFNAAGTALVYSTYLGGSGNDRSGNLGSCGAANGPSPGGGNPISGNGGDGATAIAVDAAGNAYVAGFTSSSDFPTAGPVQATNHAAAAHGSNAFLAKLNAAGNALVYSTYLGGSGTQGALITGDMATALAIDGSGSAYVTGITMSPDFPTQKPFQPANAEPSGRPTGFVAKLNAAGSALVYSSYLGGSGGSADAGVGDCANAIAVDGSGNAYVAGQTSSANFPTVAPFQPVNATVESTVDSGLGTAFVTKLNSTGSALIYSTYLGGSTSEAALAVAVDASGDAYLAGYTSSSDFPTANALQAQNATGGHGANAFVTKFNPAGSGLVYSTYLGGSIYEQANALALDSAGNAYVAGTTYSDDFPVVEPLQATNDASSGNANNAFISMFNPSGRALEFSTYLGGSGHEGFHSCPSSVDSCGPVYTGDSAAAIAVDGSGYLYLTGFANSGDFPTVSAFQTTAKSIFVTKISAAQPADPPSMNGGGGALGWGDVSLLGVVVAMRCRRRDPLGRRAST